MYEKHSLFIYILNVPSTYCVVLKYDYFGIADFLLSNEC